MDIFSVITLAGGLAFFLYGMHAMSAGLEKMAGGKLEGILHRMTSTPLKSLLLGAGITIAIQSSSAMTVMLVGLVNSGIMELSQTVGVIMGSNIGTTLTAWILSLAGIESSNVFIRLLKPESFAPIVALFGSVFIMFSKKTRRKDIGGVLVGFAILMYGMTLMSGAVSPLADIPEFQSLMTAFSNPFLGVLVGAVFTAIIQSSAASVGILQALALTGGVSYAVAIPIIMGQNIGTCVTALLSSIGVSKNAKRVSVIHVLFNVLGTAICLAIFCLLRMVFDFTPLDSPIGALGIAVFHSIFNILTTALLLPFSKKLVLAAQKIIHSDNKEEKVAPVFLDERLLNTPSVAISECSNFTVQMAGIAGGSVRSVMNLLQNYSPDEATVIESNENLLDTYEDKLGTYLVQLSKKELSDSDSKMVSKILHTIGDFERLGDHALNLLHTAQEIHEKKIQFSDEAKQEIALVSAALTEIVTISIEAFCTANLELASHVEPLEQVIDGLVSEIKDNHIRRLQNGSCTIEQGFVLSDLLANYERISDHCSNIAVALIEVSQNSFDTHEYLHSVKTMDNDTFRRYFSEYGAKYTL